MTISQRIDAAYEYIRTRTDAAPAVGLILGSGLGDFCDRLEGRTVVPFAEIPGFPVSTVEGHAGAFVFGTYRGQAVAALQGRIHYYEGYDQQEITLPVRVMARLGVRSLVLTNAAGGVNLDFAAGCLMLIADHINFSGRNPLIGPNLDQFGPRFPDMSDIYTRALREKIRPLAAQAGIDLREGVYMMYSGPSYETPAEIRCFRTMGADAVGMSTVPEAIVARHCGMDVVGVSCITNMAAGVLDRKLDHSEVVETARRVKGNFTRLLEIILDVLRG